MLSSETLPSARESDGYRKIGIAVTQATGHAAALFFLATAAAIAQSSITNTSYYEVAFITDSTISFSVSEDDNPASVVLAEPQENGRFIHRIVVDQPLEYRDCAVEYRRAKKVRVRWTPPPGFSARAASEYELVLSIIEPTHRSATNSVIELSPPEGFTRSYLEQYEARREGYGVESIRAFFQAAFLTQHFAHALPKGHGFTRRMANASIDHLSVANNFFRNISLQPGFAFEGLVSDNVGSDDRGRQSMRTLRGMNMSFFRDVGPAMRQVASGDEEKCRAGLKILRELANCHDAIFSTAPALLENVMSVVNQNVRDADAGNNFNFELRIAEAEVVCSSNTQ